MPDGAQQLCVGIDGLLDEMSVHYDEDYFEHGVQTGKSMYENYHWMPELTIRMAYHIIQYLGLKAKDKVLDYGCAKGYLVKALRILDIDAYGCDISSYAIDKVDSEVVDFCYLISHQMSFDDKFDWVVSKDVLEHMTVKQVKQFLQESHSWSKRAFHVIPLGDGNRYIAEQYERDNTHILREDCQWWTQMFASCKWQIKAFRYAVAGVKENWTSRYPKANGFFTVGV